MKPAISASLVLLTALASASLAVDTPDFFGSYTETGRKGGAKFDKTTASKLKVVQTTAAIEVTEVWGGKTQFNRYPLDGSEGGYTSSGGITGKCKAHFKGKYLFLDSFVTTYPQTNGPAVRIHTTERWELSKDLKTLTIRTETDFPNLPISLINPVTEIYTRD